MKIFVLILILALSAFLYAKCRPISPMMILPRKFTQNFTDKFWKIPGQVWYDASLQSVIFK